MSRQHAILNVASTASQSEIRDAYLRLASKCHPDFNNTAAVEEFKILSDAYEILSERRRRQLNHRDACPSKFREVRRPRHSSADHARFTQREEPNNASRPRPDKATGQAAGRAKGFVRQSRGDCQPFVAIGRTLLWAVVLCGVFSVLAFQQTSHRPSSNVLSKHPSSSPEVVLQLAARFTDTDDDGPNSRHAPDSRALMDETPAERETESNEHSESLGVSAGPSVTTLQTDQSHSSIESPPSRMVEGAGENVGLTRRSDAFESRPSQRTPAVHTSSAQRKRARSHRSSRRGPLRGTWTDDIVACTVEFGKSSTSEQRRELVDTTRHVNPLGLAYEPDSMTRVTSVPGVTNVVAQSRVRVLQNRPVATGKSKATRHRARQLPNGKFGANSSSPPESVASNDGVRRRPYKPRYSAGPLRPHVVQRTGQRWPVRDTSLWSPSTERSAELRSAATSYLAQSSVDRVTNRGRYSGIRPSLGLLAAR